MFSTFAHCAKESIAYLRVRLSLLTQRAKVESYKDHNFNISTFFIYDENQI